MSENQLQQDTPHFTPEAELTGEHIDRQDEVDNAIMDFIQKLIPPQYRKPLPEGECQFDWDAEWGANLRDDVQTIIFDLLGLSENEREQFEMNFYPFLKNEE